MPTFPLPSLPLVLTCHDPSRTVNIINLHHKASFICPKRLSNIVFASKKDAYDHDYDGRVVDENMIVLRMRIHEMERNMDEPPREWMEWEKSYYTSYDSDICEAMGFLQSLLMDTRPSLALGMVALVVLSVSTSTAVVGFHFVELVKEILARVNFG